MIPSIIRRPSADEDLLNHYVFIGLRSRDAAERFFDAAENTIEFLSKNRFVGSPWQQHDLALKSIRYWPIEGFRNHLIFYRPTEYGIEVLHIFHASRDLSAVLQADSTTD